MGEECGIFYFFPDLYVHEIPTKYPGEKKLELTKHIREKTLDPQNIQKKNFGLTKYPCEKILDQINAQEKKYWANEKPTRKNFGPTKYPREKTFDPRNSHEKKFRGHKNTMAG